jgi:transcriptional regulator with XRE-family HTH domain
MRNPKKTSPEWQVGGIRVRVAAERTRLGLSQRELCSKAGAHSNFVHQVETGSGGPLTAVLRWIRLAEALGVRLEWLLTGKGVER